MLFIYASIEYYLIFHNRRNEGVFNLNWNMVNSTNTFWNCLAKNLPIHNIPSYFIFKHILICYSYIRIIINIPKNLLHYDLLWPGLTINALSVFCMILKSLAWDDIHKWKTPILNIHFEGTVVSSFQLLTEISLFLISNVLFHFSSQTTVYCVIGWWTTTKASARQNSKAPACPGQTSTEWTPILNHLIVIVPAAVGWLFTDWVWCATITMHTCALASIGQQGIGK